MVTVGKPSGKGFVQCLIRPDPPPRPVPSFVGISTIPPPNESVRWFVVRSLESSGGQVGREPGRGPSTWPGTGPVTHPTFLLNPFDYWRVTPKGSPSGSPRTLKPSEPNGLVGPGTSSSLTRPGVPKGATGGLMTWRGVGHRRTAGEGPLVSSPGPSPPPSLRVPGPGSVLRFRRRPGSRGVRQRLPRALA